MITFACIVGLWITTGYIVVAWNSYVEEHPFTYEASPFYGQAPRVPGTAGR